MRKKKIYLCFCGNFANNRDGLGYNLGYLLYSFHSLHLYSRQLFYNTGFHLHKITFTNDCYQEIERLVVISISPQRQVFIRL